MNTKVISAAYWDQKTTERAIARRLRVAHQAAQCLPPIFPESPTAPIHSLGLTETEALCHPVALPEASSRQAEVHSYGVEADCSEPQVQQGGE